MPTKVTREGRDYYEYSPQELDAMRNRKLEEHYIRNGQTKFAVSPFTNQQAPPTGGKKGIR